MLTNKIINFSSYFGSIVPKISKCAFFCRQKCIFFFRRFFRIATWMLDWVKVVSSPLFSTKPGSLNSWYQSRSRFIVSRLWMTSFSNHQLFLNKSSLCQFCQDFWDLSIPSRLINGTNWHLSRLFERLLILDICELMWNMFFSETLGSKVSTSINTLSNDI